MDLVIRSVHVFDTEEVVDVGIDNGVITVVAPRIDEKGALELDGGNGFLSPAFADVHTHLDKTMLADGREFPTLQQAIAAFDDYCATRLTKADVKNRARQMLNMALANGTLYVRTHVTFWGNKALDMLEALLEVKEEYAGLVELQIFPMAFCYGEPLSPETRRAMHNVASLNIAGFDASAHMSSEPEAVVDAIFEICAQHDLLADFHVDETDRPDIRSLKQICRRMEEDPSWHGLVSAGHICALSAVEDGEAAETIARMADVGLNAIVMASCNLYLMGRTDKQPIRRGITRVREMVEAGVNVACASDNVRDYFRPFGNADILEETLITAQVAQMGTPSDLKKIYRMGTYNAARIFGLKQYGVKPGCVADLVLLEASDDVDAIIGQVNKRYVFKGGKVVSETCCDIKSVHPFY